MGNPYRLPAPAEVEPKPRRWHIRLAKAFAVAGAIFIGRAMYIDIRDWVPPLSRPCTEYQNWPSKDVPARCTKTYDPAGLSGSVGDR